MQSNSPRDCDKERSRVSSFRRTRSGASGAETLGRRRCGKGRRTDASAGDTTFKGCTQSKSIQLNRRPSAALSSVSFCPPDGGGSYLPCFRHFQLHAGTWSFGVPVGDHGCDATPPENKTCARCTQGFDTSRKNDTTSEGLARSLH